MATRRSRTASGALRWSSRTSLRHVAVCRMRSTAPLLGLRPLHANSTNVVSGPSLATGAGRRDPRPGRSAGRTHAGPHRRLSAGRRVPEMQVSPLLQAGAQGARIRRGDVVVTFRDRGWRFLGGRGDRADRAVPDRGVAPFEWVDGHGCDGPPRGRVSPNRGCPALDWVRSRRSPGPVATTWSPQTSTGMASKWMGGTTPERLPLSRIVRRCRIHVFDSGLSPIGRSPRNYRVRTAWPAKPNTPGRISPRGGVMALDGAAWGRLERVAC